MKRHQVEISAPAGSWASLTAAVQGNADSVYFGAEQFNMRASSSENFSLSDLPEIVSFCKSHGIKCYLALNIVIYDDEINKMKKIIDTAAKSGISAIIATDQSVINYAFSKGLEVHLSTQLNITNTDTLKFYSQWADVAVLARELSLEQIKKISDEIKKRKICGPSGKPFRIEIFAHGALCMAISGKCYLSLHEYNKSANRGLCNQVCRRSYIVTDKETGFELEIDNQYIMSAKDLCTIGFLDRIIEAGAEILKIEGRARSPEYVRTVTSCYDEALRAIEQGTYTPENIKKWTERLSTVFNRGFWDGYYLGRKMGEWTNKYGSSATMKKTYIGKITNYYNKIGVAEIKLENGDLSIGDTILIIGPTTGALEYRVEEIRDSEHMITEKALKGTFCSIKTDHYLRRSDKVYKWEERNKE
ncbi:MAG TPA: peptidase U32 family protein [Bacteroidales bacterium]|nr:peptidase U32 family protein [Bacteroidales bacterium]HRT46788.1 peptidase U32 family protein [Bacteroidales bacterium]